MTSQESFTKYSRKNRTVNFFNLKTTTASSKTLIINFGDFHWRVLLSLRVQWQGKAAELILSHWDHVLLGHACLRLGNIEQKASTLPHQLAAGITAALKTTPGLNNGPRAVAGQGSHAWGHSEEIGTLLWGLTGFQRDRNGSEGATHEWSKGEPKFLLPV